MFPVQIFQTKAILTLVAGGLGVISWPEQLVANDGPRPFPARFTPRPAKVAATEAPADSLVAWQTEHFAIVSDLEIAPNRLQSFATTLESVPAVLGAHPLGMWSPRGEGRQVVRLCRDAGRFSDFGGPLESAGSYDGRRNEVLIRADLLLTPPASGTRLKEPPDDDLLVHEMTHLATSGILGGSPPWLSEGLAEYFAVAHRGGGHYRFDQWSLAMPKHLRRHLALEPTDVIVLPSLKSVVGMSNREWSQSISSFEVAERYLPYATALLFVHYCLEGSDSRRAEFSAYIEGFRSRKRRRDPIPTFRIEDPAEVEERLAGFWSRHGLKLRFE